MRGYLWIHRLPGSNDMLMGKFGSLMEMMEQIRKSGMPVPNWDKFRVSQGAIASQKEAQLKEKGNKPIYPHELIDETFKYCLEQWLIKPIELTEL